MTRKLLADCHEDQRHAGGGDGKLQLGYGDQDPYKDCYSDTAYSLLALDLRFWTWLFGMFTKPTPH